MVSLAEWEYTNPKQGNSWQAKAGGRHVVLQPLWMYCDNTSGNMLKKWNKHNSYLFTLAGLLKVQVSKEYNVHFLCMSNIAEPLKTMDGVVNQIEYARLINHSNQIVLNRYLDRHRRLAFGLGTTKHENPS